MKVLLLLFLFVSCTYSVNVLLVYAGPYNADVVQKLSPFFSLTAFNGATGTITLSYALTFDVILLYTDSSLANPTATGTVLASYVDSGKPVVLMTFTMDDIGLGGAFSATNGPYTVMNSAPQTQGTTLNLVPVIGNHPILEGVHSFIGGSSSYHGRNSLNPNAILVASWSDSSPLIATMDVHGVRRVDLNFYPPSSDIRADFWSSNTDGVKIMVNAILWAANGLVSTTAIPTTAIPTTAVPTTATPTTGFPAIPCQFDWQCAASGQNYGFATCNIDGSCACRPNFIGSAVPEDVCRCDTANGDQLAWDENGNPNCVNPGVCEIGTLIRTDLCSGYTQNYAFIQCIAGQCTCLDGFQGTATATDQCRCDNTLTWPPNGPVCN